MNAARRQECSRRGPVSGGAYWRVDERDVEALAAVSYGRRRTLSQQLIEAEDTRRRALVPKIDIGVDDPLPKVELLLALASILNRHERMLGQAAHAHLILMQLVPGGERRI
jgi:hypothetical protein